MHQQQGRNQISENMFLFYQVGAKTCSIANVIKGKIKM